MEQQSAKNTTTEGLEVEALSISSTLKTHHHKEVAAVKLLQASVWMCFHCFEALIQNLRLSFPHLLVHHRHDQTTTTSADATGDDDDAGDVVPLTMQESYTQPPPFWHDLPDEHIQCPLFVTWEKQQDKQPQRRPTSLFPHRFLSSSSPSSSQKPNQYDVSSSSYELRGCIGSLSPLPVATALTKYALLSALRDQRFAPIHPSEVSLLRVAVSLLVEYEDCQHVYDWQVGIHGIVIQFSKPTSSDMNNHLHHRKAHCHSTATTIPQQQQSAHSHLRQQQHPYSATYLPEVALEQGWDQVAAVASLIRKAGYTHDITPSLLQNIHCTRYQSSKVRLTFDEYLHMISNFHPPQAQQAQQQQQPQSHPLHHNSPQTPRTTSATTAAMTGLGRGTTTSTSLSSSSSTTEHQRQPIVNYAFRPPPSIRQQQRFAKHCHQSESSCTVL